MGYADRQYYGLCKLIVQSNAQTVNVAGGGKNWTKNTSINHIAEFNIPGTEQYTISSGGVSKTIEVGYGEYRRIQMGE